MRHQRPSVPTSPHRAGRHLLSALALLSRLAAVLVCALAGTLARAAEPLPIADSHIHYSHDAWDLVPTAEVIALMRKGGLRLALVSSSNDEGTQRLYSAAPDLIVPSLRPYRSRGEISTWVRDESVARHVQERLARHRYAAVGEFHVSGADADLPVVRRIVQLARQHNLILHAHSDADAIDRLFAQWPQARILWAHSGFDRPANVRTMLRKHPRLWADLAFRNDHGAGGKVDPEWREAFREFPDRFMVGTDTFTPERLHYIPEHAAWSRAWLADLPGELAERIAWKNAEALLMPVWRANRAAAAAADRPRDARVIEGARTPMRPASTGGGCTEASDGAHRLSSARATVLYRAEPAAPAVGQRFSVLVTVCPTRASATLQDLRVDATMPQHRHGMNYVPTIARLDANQFRADGLLMHMPGRWQISFDLRLDGQGERLVHDITVR